MRTVRYDQDTLNRLSKSDANETQKPVLEKMLETGWNVTKIVHGGTFNTGLQVAVGLEFRGIIGWLTPDGKFHRPVAGKKTVSINTKTLERVW